MITFHFLSLRRCRSALVLSLAHFGWGWSSWSTDFSHFGSSRSYARLKKVVWHELVSRNERTRNFSLRREFLISTEWMRGREREREGKHFSLLSWLTFSYHCHLRWIKCERVRSHSFDGTWFRSVLLCVHNLMSSAANRIIFNQQNDGREGATSKWNWEYGFALQFISQTKKMRRRKYRNKNAEISNFNSRHADRCVEGVWIETTVRMAYAHDGNDCHGATSTF